VRVLLVLVPLAAAAACAAANGTTAHSGLRGTVTKGPLMPVCREGVPCDGPAAGLTLVFSRNGVAVGRTTTRQDGSYRLALRPGRYAVRAVPRGLVPPEPNAVTVVADRFRRIDFFVDTGIR
jgi:hypothetical protein